MHTLGILFGFAAAAFQSGSYVFSRLFVIRRRHAVVRLLLTSHLIMAGASLLILPLAWSPRVPPFAAYALPLVGTALFYLCGQAGFFLLVRRVQASRVAPLLGIKVVILAFISAMALGRPLSGQQWMAVALCAAAALILGRSGGALPILSVACLLLTCLMYSLSDLSIERLVKALEPLSPLHASVLGVAMSYILCGAVVLILLPWSGGLGAAADWGYALPFAAFWLLSMMFLFACFGLVGPVFGNILQSTRGILSIVIGVQLTRMGYLDLEQQVPRAVFWQRAGAAALMCLAIWLYHARFAIGRF